MNVSDLFTPEELLDVCVSPVPPGPKHDALLAELRDGQKEIEGYERIVASFMDNKEFMSVMGSLLTVHRLLKRRTPPLALPDLVSVDELTAEIDRTYDVPQEPEPAVMPYIKAVNAFTANQDEFCLVMGTLGVLQRILAAKVTQ